MLSTRGPGPRLRITPLSVSTVLAAVLPAALLLWGGYVRRWAGDDGFINLRVVDQLLAGNGFVVNAGERVEGVTSAAWVFVLWLLGELGFNVESAAWVVSLGFAALGVALAALAAARLALPDSRDKALVVPFGVLGYVALPPAWDYATSALENGFGLTFLGASYWLVAGIVTEKIEARRAPWIAPLVGIAPLVRPDYVLYAVPLGLTLLLAVPGRLRLQVAAFGVLPALSFQIFRMGYFAALVPNTAIAKEAFEARWEQGLLFLKNTVLSYGLVAPLIVALLVLTPTTFAALRAKKPLHALLSGGLALAGVIHIVYVVRVGGDFMHGRMLLPGLFAIFASVGAVVVDFSQGIDAVRRLTGFAVFAGWALICSLWLRAAGWEYDVLDERDWYVNSSQSPHPVHLDDYKIHPFYNWASIIRKAVADGCPNGDASLAAGSADACKRLAFPDGVDGALVDHPPGGAMPLNPKMVAPSVMAVLAFRPIGIAGHKLGPRISIVDAYGLADPIASRLQLTTRGRPGHEKALPTFWFAAKYAEQGSTVDPNVALARKALSCGSLKELHDATHEPLTFSRFFRNIRKSFRLHRVRVPTDPNEAIARFCSKQR